MHAFLLALDLDDEEHGAAWLSDGLGNSLEYEVGGNLSFRRGDLVRHLPHASVARVVELWMALSRGNFEALERLDWRPGTRPALTQEELAERARNAAQFMLQQDRALYDSFGAERSGTHCRAQGCARGTVAFSIFCRPHHFASVQGRPSPFDH